MDTEVNPGQPGERESRVSLLRGSRLPRVNFDDELPRIRFQDEKKARAVPRLTQSTSVWSSSIIGVANY